MAPIFKAKDMINLGKREFYIKLMIEGESYDPFSAETLKVLPSNHPSYREQIITASRRKYTLPRSEVERILIEEDSRGGAPPEGAKKTDLPEPLI
jgi:hypothetical protein